MWQTFAQALFTALALSGMAFGIGKLVAVMGERAIERRHGNVGIRALLARRAQFETKLEARRTARTTDLKAIDREVQDAVLRKQTLDRELAQLLRAGDQIVRLIGDEVKGSPAFVAQVINVYVGQQQHAHIDRSWAQAQTIHVWCPNVAEARKEIERRYPPAFGYKILRLDEAGIAEPLKPQTAA